jgi:RimJ/RimL family protein N-acetyltransferase
MMADPEVADGLADPIGRTPADAWRSLAAARFPGSGRGLVPGPPALGKGYATEAARAAIAYCFPDLKADEVISVIRPGNKRSLSVAERIGHRLLRETDYKDTPALIYGQQNPTS